MSEKLVRVLFVAESELGLPFLVQRLEEQGCQCQLASSYSEGMRLFAEQPFDLVLCSGRPGISALFPSVIGSSASVFCAHTVEGGCWWVPVVRHGAKCLGVSALRPDEFAEILGRMLDEIKSSARDHGIAATG